MRNKVIKCKTVTKNDQTKFMKFKMSNKKMAIKLQHAIACSELHLKPRGHLFLCDTSERAERECKNK